MVTTLSGFSYGCGGCCAVVVEPDFFCMAGIFAVGFVVEENKSKVP